MKQRMQPTIKFVVPLAILAAAGGLCAYAGDTNLIALCTNAPCWRPMQLALEAGTTGAGGTLAARFSDHFGIAGGVDYFTYSQNGRDFSGVNYDLDLRMMNENLGLRWYPWAKRSFYLSLGAIINQNRLNGRAVSDGSLVISGYTVPAGEAVDLHYTQQPVDPYVSLGGNFFYFDKARHWAFGGELGVYYLGDSKLELTSNAGDAALNAALAKQRDKTIHDLRRYPVWPILKLQVSYAF